MNDKRWSELMMMVLAVVLVPCGTWLWVTAHQIVAITMWLILISIIAAFGYFEKEES